MLADIQTELERLDASSIRVTPDEKFEPQAGELLRVESRDAYWHLLPEQFLNLLRKLPSGAGGEAVHEAIERSSPAVWHGPAPEESRDRLL